jgi:hypothetical protein
MRSKLAIDKSGFVGTRAAPKLWDVGCRMTDFRRSAGSGALILLSLISQSTVCGQAATQVETQSPENTPAQVCPDPPPQTSGSHIFRRVGETLDIPISVADCQPISIVLRWANGGNRGSLLNVTFLDDNNQPIYSRAVSVFLSGVLELPFTSFDPQPWFVSARVVAVPTSVVIQTVQPFAFPAGISYAVSRRGPQTRSRPQAASQAVAQTEVSTHSRPLPARPPILNEQVAAMLRTADGRLLSQGQGSWAVSGGSVRYKLKELSLPGPREIEGHGRRKKIEHAYRLTLSGAESRSTQPVGTVQVPPLSKFGLIWLDDVVLPAFSLDAQEVSTLIYDRSILREGAQISVSDSDGSDRHVLVEGLKYESSNHSPTSVVETRDASGAQAAGTTVETFEGDEGNVVVSIKRALRLIGATRIPLVQIELITNRSFPPRETALQLQVGKRFFLKELTGEPTGRTLTLTITEEMFTELKQGADIVAFFDRPDRSGFAGGDVWYFGRLDKRKRL